MKSSWIVTQNGLQILQRSITTVTTLIKSGDDGLRSLDHALTGNRPKYGESPGEAFMGVLDMLQGTLEEAREKKSATDPTVVQNSRVMLKRINEAEPNWKPAPMGLRTASDVYRAALRDLRGSTSLIRLAAGQGSINDLEGLSKWAEDLNGRLDQVKGSNGSQLAEEGPQLAPGAPLQLEQSTSEAPAKKRPTRAKRNTAPKTPPADADIAFARAVAEDMNDEKVTKWFGEFEKGKISEAQWISRLTSHAAATKDSLDDVFQRATEKVTKAGNGK